MTGVGVRLAALLLVYAAVVAVILFSFGYWINAVAPEGEDHEFRRALTAFFFIPFSGAVALVGGALWMYASYSVALARFWPVIAEIVDWERVDALLAPPEAVLKGEGK